MRNARQFDTRRFDIRIGRLGASTGRSSTGRPRRPVHPITAITTSGPSWPAPASGYLEATGRDEQGHLLLTVVPVRAEDHVNLL